tara:strand:+ start:1030 stop:1194 length:165 start_codon:yes stop_codon:yes gene_type:complete
MKNREVNINISGKHIHRTPIEMDNPEKTPKHDWWDELCKKHNAKNYFPKDKKKK